MCRSLRVPTALMCFTLCFIAGAWLSAGQASAATLLSSLTDPAGDGGPHSYLDIISAKVVQVDSNLLQFEMTLVTPPPSDSDPNHFYTYIWFVDADENVSTGQSQSGIGSDYNLRAVSRAHWSHGRAFVDVIPPAGVVSPVGTLATKHVDQATSTVRLLVQTEQIGSPDKFRWSCGTFSHDSGGDHIHDSSQAVVMSTAPPTGTMARVILEPTISLRDGVITRSVRPRLFDAEGNRLDSAGHDVVLHAYQDVVDCEGEFITAHPGVVTRTHISAAVDGVLSWNPSEVMVGSLLIRPAVLLLDTAANTSGYVQLEATAADGAPVSHVGHDVVLANDDNSVAAFDPDTGLLTAMPEGEGRDSRIRGSWDEVPVNNSCWARVVSGAVEGPPPSVYTGDHCCYWLPGSVVLDLTSGVSIDEMMARWDVAHSMDVAYSLMCRLLGNAPWLGDTQDLAGIEVETANWACSGNPIGLSYNPTVPQSAIQDGLGAPHFGVMAHEVGHNVAGACEPLWRSLWPSSDLPQSGSYCEAIATLLSMCAQAGFLEGPAHYGVDPDMVDAAGDDRVYGSIPFSYRVFLADLADYLVSGSNYEDLTANVLDGMCLDLADTYGWETYQRFFGAFWPPHKAFPMEITTVSEQATMFAAAVGSAADADLRPLFRDDWGFPIDDAFYEMVTPMLQQRIRWRGDDFYWLFDDVPPTHWAFQQIAAITDATIAKGYSASPPSYRPDVAVTRDQMAVYIARALAGGDDNVPDLTGEPTFPDVPEGFWALDYVEYAVSKNVVAGYDDGLYRPDAEVTRDQMAVYIARALVAPTGEAALADYVPADPRNFPDVPATGYGDDGTDPYWAYTHIEYCVEHGVVQGYDDGTYHPEYVVTRDQMAVYIARAFGLLAAN